jgi:acetyltransferase
MNPLHALLSPESVVIIGASADPNKVNGRPIRNLRRDGFSARVYLVNPKYSDILGYPCFPDLDSLPEVPELGVVGVAAEGAREVVAALGAKGVKTAIVWSSGFAEMGPSGKQLEDDLVKTARHWGMRILGPNSLGLTNAFKRMPLTFSQYADEPLQAGPVAFVSQSGAFGTAVATAARSRGIGLGYFVSTGNQPDLTVAAVIEAVLDDERIRVVVAYMEGLPDGSAFVAAARRALMLEKPLVVVKVGRHPAGSRAAVSHTGSLSGDDAIFDSVMHQHGVLRADNESHALDLVSALVNCPVPSLSKSIAISGQDGVGLITVSGGAGVLMADLAEEMGLAVPTLLADTQSRLSSVLRGFAATGNPVDVTGQSIEDITIFQRSLEIVLDDPQVAVCVIWVQLLHAKADQLVDLLVQCKQRAVKPFILCWLNSPPAAVQRLRLAGVCVVDSTLGGIQSAAGLLEVGHARLRHLAEPVVVQDARALATKKGVTEIVDSMKAAHMLGQFGLVLAETRMVTNADAAVAAAADLRFPVAIKIESRDLPHKTEAGGVLLNLKDEAAVREAFKRVIESALAYKCDAQIDGVLVQAMQPQGCELVLGIKRDEAFGSVVMLGLGGIFIEALRDVVFATPPISREAARHMIGRLRGQVVLDGIRGRPSVNREALIDAICALSQFAMQQTEVCELDLNPVFAYEQGVVVVDWLMVSDQNA